MRGVLWAVLLVSISSPALADEIKNRRMSFYEGSDAIKVSVRYSELLRGQAANKLSSGFPTTVIVRAYVYEKDSQLPVDLVVATHRVVYDLWDEVYTVRSVSRTERSTRRLKNKKDVIRALTRLDRFPVASLSNVKVGPHYFLGLVVELNPVSKQLMAEMRRWLTRPAGKAQLDTTSSFFGSFVSVFVNPKLSAADKILRFRSQPFYRPRRRR
jgi:hypothetical protein